MTWGIIRDAVTFLLNTTYATEVKDERFRKYFAAQRGMRVAPFRSSSSLII